MGGQTSLQVRAKLREEESERDRLAEEAKKKRDIQMKAMGRIQVQTLPSFFRAVFVFYVKLKALETDCRTKMEEASKMEAAVRKIQHLEEKRAGFKVYFSVFYSPLLGRSR